jgi:hypothetical protein
MVRLGRVLSLAILWPALTAPSAAAQSWTPQQRAVLDRINACHQILMERNPQAELECYHRDFVGWRNSMPATRDYAHIRMEIERNASDPNAARVIAVSIQPLAVLVQGNVAIVHYYSYISTRTSAGVMTEQRSRWTDILLNEGGRWAWIADHGGVDPGTPAVAAAPSGGQ